MAAWVTKTMPLKHASQKMSLKHASQTMPVKHASQTIPLKEAAVSQNNPHQTQAMARSPKYTDVCTARCNDNRWRFCITATSYSSPKRLYQSKSPLAITLFVRLTERAPLVDTAYRPRHAQWPPSALVSEPGGSSDRHLCSHRHRVEAIYF